MRGRKEVKKYVIKRELTLDNQATDATNSYWGGIEKGWVPLPQAIQLSKQLMQRILSTQHSDLWHTHREHAHLQEVE